MYSSIFTRTRVFQLSAIGERGGGGSTDSTWFFYPLPYARSHKYFYYHIYHIVSPLENCSNELSIDSSYVVNLLYEANFAARAFFTSEQGRRPIDLHVSSSSAIQAVKAMFFAAVSLSTSMWSWVSLVNCCAALIYTLILTFDSEWIV